MFMSWPSYGENRKLAGLGAGEHSKDPKLYIQVLELYQTEANTSSTRETFKLPGGQVYMEVLHGMGKTALDSPHFLGHNLCI